MIRRGISLLALTPLVLFAACGGDDDAGDAAEQVDRAIEENLPGGTLPDGADVTLPEQLDELLPGGSFPDVSLPDEFEDLLPGGTLPADLDDLPGAEAQGSGSCSVALTGGHTAEWGEQQSTSSGVVSYWFGDTERSFWGDGFTIVANCSGDGTTNFSLLSGADADESSVPMAPGTYELQPGGPLGSNGLWSILMTIDGNDALFGITEPGGTLEITEFDDDTFAFVVDATVVDTFASMTGGSEEPAQLHVEFTMDRVDL